MIENIKSMDPVELRRVLGKLIAEMARLEKVTDRVRADNEQLRREVTALRRTAE